MEAVSVRKTKLGQPPLGWGAFTKSRVPGVVVLLVLWAAAAGSRAFAQFETRASFDVGYGPAPFSVVVGDFNGDGLLDVAELNYEPTGSVEILLGNGDGTFRRGAVYRVPATLYAATASLRHNGVLDLVLGGLGTDAAYVMLGNGDGTFQAPVPNRTSGEPEMVELGSFTGSGNLDILAVENTGAQGVVCDCIEVLPGKGDGTFGAPIKTPLSNMTPFAIASGDFNNDGKLDVAVSGDPGLVDIFLGNGDGTFTEDGNYTVSGNPASIAIGYFTSDKKKLDLAVANFLGSSLSVLLGNGDGTFQQSVYYGTSFPTWVIAQDLDGDGNIDLAASNPGLPGDLEEFPPGVSVLRGNGDGTFQPGVFYPAGSRANGNYVVAGDFNGDHRLDLVDVDTDGETVITLLNTGVVSFSPTTPLIFQKQAVGTTSIAQTVTLTNTGSTDLKIQSMRASAEFAVKSTCGAVVAPSATCTITATFSPTEQGTVPGTITIIDSASSKPQVIELSGFGS